ncbi:MAG: peptide ABC transporter substrate-binding protein [Chloroflexi bacterium]|nr:peptide ABC transporter substrate-binding protein [Chloroflexota bacterium]
MRGSRMLVFFWGLLVLLIGGGCQAEASVTPLTLPKPTVTPLSPPTPAVRVVTPTAPPPPPPVLVVCMGREPRSLYPYAADLSLEARNLLAALYEPLFLPDGKGGWETRVLERVPSLENGDARVERVTVRLGERLVDAEGRVTVLQPGVRYRPPGCREDACLKTVDEETDSIETERLVVQFRLRPGLHWADGQPVTADDSVFAFELEAASETPRPKWYTDRTASYRAVDERTVVWTGLPGYFAPDYMRRFWMPLPRHRWGDKSPQQLLTDPEAARQPLGWGPYQIAEWKPGSGTLRLTPNPYYEPKPYFTEIVVRFVGNDPDTALAHLMAGTCDVVSQTTGLEEQWSLLLALAQVDQARVDVVPSAFAFEHIGLILHPVAHDDGFQYRDPPGLFVDPRTRQALALCLDREALVRDLLRGAAPVLHSYVPEDYPTFNPDVPRYPYDPAKARELLAEAGWVDDDEDPTTPLVFQGRNRWIPANTRLQFTLLTTTAPLRQALAERVKHDWAQCGVEVDVRALEPETLFAPGPTGPVFGRRAQAALFAWSVDPVTACRLWLSEAIPGPPETRVEDVAWMPDELGPERDAFALDWNGWNYYAYANPDLDRACRAVLFNLPETRSFAEGQAATQAILMEDLPFIPLYPRLRFLAYRPNVCGPQLRPDVALEWWNIGEWAMEPGCANP